MRQRERGSAMAIVMICIAAVIAGAAALTAMQTKSSRGATLTHTQTDGLYCAEAGITSVRATVIANQPLWNAAFVAGTEPAWLAAIDHDLDNDGAADFVVTLEDNDDDDPNDPAVDTDSTVFIVSTCIKHTDTPTRVTELVNTAGTRKLWMRTE